MFASLFRAWRRRDAAGVVPPAAPAETAAGLVAQGNAALRAGQPDDAERCYRRAALIQPDLAAAHLNLGFVLSDRGRVAEALSSLHHAARLEPSSCDAHYLIGTLHAGLGAPALAIDSFERAIAIDPAFMPALRDLGKVLSDTGQHEAAARSLRQALALDAGRVELHLFLGNVLAADGQLDAAVASYEEAIRLSPGDANLHANLALALANRGDDAAAVVSARRALALDPGLFHARSNLLLALSRHPGCAPSEYLAEARAYDSALVERGMTRPPRPEEATGADPARRLRIGFVSGDLRSHPVGYFLDGVMPHWDHAAMEAIAYSNHRATDALTARLRGHFDAWHDISGLTDDAAESRLRADRIDVLIDLSGHTPGNRLPLFARRPAPVQVSWLGYWASTGVSAIDCLLCDRVSVVDGGAAQFSERLVFLPDTRLCFSPPAGAESLPVAPLPALSAGHLTFGSFQGVPKLNDPVLRLWARVLRALPDARLRLQSAQFGTEPVRARLLGRLVSVGIDAERVTLVAPGPRLAYLAAHAEVDILLDSFPHGGATTTCEALWMGVPTVTLAGETLLARQGASLLTCAGLSDWVATSEDDYVARAVHHASDLDVLARLRAGSRERLSASPLVDGGLFARNLQNALRRMSVSPVSTNADDRGNVDRVHP